MIMHIQPCEGQTILLHIFVILFCEPNLYLIIAHTGRNKTCFPLLFPNVQSTAFYICSHTATYVELVELKIQRLQ